MEVRPYDPDRDREGLWALKAAFERGLGGVADDDGKAEAYDEKLTEGYRARYLDWVDRCVDESPGCVAVADGDGLEGYAFLLPESLAMIWD
nr:GNAT family N-acetyltransferase [Actinomycetota bacterium]